MRNKKNIIIAWLLTFLTVISSPGSVKNAYAESDFLQTTAEEAAVIETAESESDENAVEIENDEAENEAENKANEDNEESAEDVQPSQNQAADVRERIESEKDGESNTEIDIEREYAIEEDPVAVTEEQRVVSTYTYEDEKVYVKVECDSAEALPDDAEVNVEEIDKEDLRYEKYSKPLEEIENIQNYLLYSITFTVVDDKGNKVIVEPEMNSEAGSQTGSEAGSETGEITIQLIYKESQLEEVLKAEEDKGIVLYRFDGDREEEKEIRAEKVVEQEVSLYESSTTFKAKTSSVIAVARELTEEEIKAQTEEKSDTEPATNEKIEYHYEDEKIEVTAVLDSPDAIPDTAELKVTEITEESDPDRYSAYRTALTNAQDEQEQDEFAQDEQSQSEIGQGEQDINAPGSSDQETSEVILFYDVSFLGTGEDGTPIEYEPAEGSVQVTMRFKNSQLTEELEAEEAQEVLLYHLPLIDGADESHITSDDIIVEPIEEPELSLVEGGADEATFSLSQFSVIGAKRAPREAENTSGSGVTASYISSQMDFVNHFAIFAMECSLQNHMEGNIAVQRLTYVQSQFGNSTRSVQKAKFYEIKVKKIVEGAGGIFRFGLFIQNSGGGYISLNKTCDITVPDNGSGEDVFSGTFPNDQSIYVFELDANGNPITTSGQKVTLNNLEYTVTFDGGQAVTQYTTLNDYNTSYVEYFDVGGQSQNDNIYNKIDNKPGHIVMGQTNTLGEDQNHHPFINNKLGTSDAATVERVSGAFPVDFASYMSSMKELSKTLAVSTSTDSVEVLNYTAAPNDDFAKEEYINFNISDDKILVINIDCTNVSNYAITKIAINEKRADAWESDASLGQNVMFNLYKRVNGQIEPYDGNLTVKEGIGTFLVPAASVTNEATSLGSFIANKLTLRNSEIHKRVPGTTTATGTFEVKNKCEVKPTDLTLRKKDGRTEEVLTSDVSMKLEKKDANGSWITVKDANSTEIPTVNESGEIHYTSLLPGEYRITEVSTKRGYDILTKQITFTIQNDGSITDLSDSGTYAKLETSDGAPPVLVINNFKTIVMPETGRNSALWFTMTGLLIMLVGLAALEKAAATRKRER